MTIKQPDVRQPRQRLLAGIPVSERRLDLAGISTPVLEGGAGPPVLLLHGPGGDATHWTRVIPELAATHRVVAPDLPGQGASDVGGGPLDADRVVTWLGELIERTCASPPTLVGHAVGGAIAARFAADAADRLSRLVLVDVLGLVPFEPAPDFGRALHGYLGGPSEETHDRLWRHCARDLDALREGIGQRWTLFRANNVDHAQMPSVMAALGVLMEQFGEPAIPSAELDRIGVPTSLIWGRHDSATPLRVAQEASARYGWPLDVIEDCGDDPPIEQPDAFLRALRGD